jgi:acyl-CoA hydrolase
MSKTERIEAMIERAVAEYRKRLEARIAAAASENAYFDGDGSNQADDETDEAFEVRREQEYKAVETMFRAADDAEERAEHTRDRLLRLAGAA